MAINCDDAGVPPHLLPVIAGARNLLTVTDSTAAQGSLAVADIVYVSRLKSHWADRVIMERVIRTVAWVVTERCLQKVLVLLLYTAPSNVHPTLPCLAGLWGLHLALAPPEQRACCCFVRPCDAYLFRKYAHACRER